MFSFSKPPLGLLPNQAHPILKGCTGWWLLNEKRGRIVNNVIRNARANTGSLVNFDQPNMWVGSKFGGALSFDGVDDRIDTNSAFAPSNTFSIGAWRRPTGAITIHAESTTGADGTDGERYAFYP